MANITADYAFESGRADKQRALAWVRGGAPVQREYFADTGPAVGAIQTSLT